MTVEISEEVVVVRCCSGIPLPFLDVECEDGVFAGPLRALVDALEMSIEVFDEVLV